MKRKIISAEDLGVKQLLSQANQSLYDTWYNYAEDGVSYSWVVKHVQDTVELAFEDDDTKLPARWRSQVRNYVKDHYNDYDWNY